MDGRDKRELRAAFGKVRKDVEALNTRLEAFEGDLMRTVRTNLRELKDKLADGIITTQEYDAKSKRILEWDLR